MNVYVASGPKAIRLSRLSQEQLEDGSIAPTIECTFPAPKGRKTKKKGVVIVNESVEGEIESSTAKPSKKATKNKATTSKAKPIVDEEKDLASGSEEEYGYSGIDDDLGEKESSTETFLPSSELGPAEWEVTRPALKKRGVTGKEERNGDVLEISD